MKKLIIAAIVLIGMFLLHQALHKKPTLSEKRTAYIEAYKETAKANNDSINLNAYFEKEDLVINIQFENDFYISESLAEAYFDDMKSRLSLSQIKFIRKSLDFSFININIKDKSGVLKSTYKGSLYHN